VKKRMEVIKNYLSSNSEVSLSPSKEELYMCSRLHLKMTNDLFVFKFLFLFCFRDCFQIC
jgi:hypothetical protein